MSVKTFKEGIKFELQSADPSATEGQVQFADGSVRNKGLWQYKDGAWSAIGGGAGDADTIHLIKANDSQASDFSLKSIDDVLPDFEGSDTLAGTFSIPTTGSEALLSNDDDHKVFKFASAASSQYDAWGISKAIPRYIRGEDIVLQFKYRTADTSGDSANADYMIWLWDQTNGVNTTTTTTGVQSAGSTLTVGTTTGMSVGDKIWIGHSGSTTEVVEAHITEVPSGTTLKVSEDLNLASGDRFVTGILTDVLTTLDAADDDTNKTGNDYKVVANIPSDCSNVTLMFQQRTSETDSFLFVDNILISSEVVKRVFARGESKKYKISEAQNAMSNLTNEVQFNSPVETYDEGFLDLFTIDHSSDPSKWTAKKKVKVSVQVNGELASARQMHLAVNGTPLMNGTTTDTSNYNNFVSADTVLNKGDYITFGSGSDGSFDGTSLGSTATSCIATFTATPEVNDVVVVESTDSVISEWTDYTPTLSGFGTTTSESFYYRRVGDSVEIMGRFVTGTVTATYAAVSLPFGLQVDTTKIGSGSISTGYVVGSGTRGAASTGGNDLVMLYSGDNTNISMSIYDNPSLQPFTSQLANAFLGSANNVEVRFKVPIAGWDANPKPLLALPTITYGQDAEEYRTSDALGYGSTATKIPYYKTTPDKNTISNLGTITNDSTNGFAFTATRRCKVHAHVSATFTAAEYIGWTLNSNPATAIGAVTEEEILAITRDSVAGEIDTVSCSVILEPGDVIRPHTNGAVGLDGNDLLHAISLLVEPEEGQVNQAAIISQPVAFVKDVKASTTDGGTFTSGAWQTRDLNTLEGDIAAVGVTLSSNQFTLPAGKYVIEAEAPSFNVTYNKCALYNITDSEFAKIGSEAYSGADNQTHSMIKAHIIITKSVTFELQHRCETTNATIGFGITNTLPEVSVYSQVKITRLK